MTFGAIALGIAWFAAWLMPRLAFQQKKKKKKNKMCRPDRANEHTTCAARQFLKDKTAFA